MVHSDSRWTRGVQVKLWDPLRTRAIPERLRGAFSTRRYTNPRLPLPFTFTEAKQYTGLGKAEPGIEPGRWIFQLGHLTCSAATDQQSIHVGSLLFQGINLRRRRLSLLVSCTEQCAWQHRSPCSDFSAQLLKRVSSLFSSLPASYACREWIDRGINASQRFRFCSAFFYDAEVSGRFAVVMLRYIVNIDMSFRYRIVSYRLPQYQDTLISAVISWHCCVTCAIVDLAVFYFGHYK